MGGVTPPFKTKRIVELDWGHPMGGFARPALDQFAWPRLPKCRVSPAKLFCMRCSHPNKKQPVVFAWCHPMEWSTRPALCLARLAQLPGQSSQAFSKWGDHPLPPSHSVVFDWAHPMGGAARPVLGQFGWPGLPNSQASPANLCVLLRGSLPYDK